LLLSVVALENVLNSFYGERRKMKRRPPAKLRRKSHSTVHHHSVNDCRAIVAVDGTKIRKKIKKEYERVLQDLDISRNQLEQFHQSDLPEYTRWLNSHFGALLTELRELSQKLALDEELIFEVEDEVIFGSDSPAHAYKRVMEYRENPEPPDPPRDGRDDPKEGNEQWKNPVDDFFNQFFGETDRDQDPREKEPRRAKPIIGSAVAPSPTSRLKELYRSLVRRLHPDTQREMTAQKAEWWHQAQAAYQVGDAEQLEVILTLCEIGEKGTTEQTSVSLLQRITEKLKSSLRQIKRQIGSHRKDPAWNFSSRTDRDSLATQMRRSLMSDLEIMRERWQLTQTVIADWQAAAARINKRSRRKRAQRENPYF
jgi:hypothetical protein